SAAAAPRPSPPPLPPFQAVSPSPVAALSSPSPLRVEVQPSATPTPQPTPTPAARLARVTNTGGIGAYLRREPAATSPPIAAAAENSIVRLLGPEQRAADGRLWRQVEDSRGNQGWVPADFLVETPAAR